MDPIQPLTEGLKSVAAWLDAFEIPWMVIGGVAVALTGRPRATVDADVTVLVEDSELEHLISAASDHGIEPRVTDALSFALENRVLLMRHNASGASIDVSLGMLPFEVEALDRALRTDIGGFCINVASADDLVIMKAIAGRDKDWADIEGIISLCKNLDLDRIRRGVRDFAELLGDARAVQKLESLLSSSGQ